MVNSRINSLKFTRIFNKNLHSTDVFDTQKSFRQITSKFDMNPGEKQAEIYTYEAPWLIYACNWSVRLRSFFLYTRKALHASLFFSLFLSLCIVRWNSNREPLFILFGMGSKLYPRDVVYFILYTSDHSRAFQLTTTCSSFLSLFRVINILNT